MIIMGMVVPSVEWEGVDERPLLPGVHLGARGKYEAGEQREGREEESHGLQESPALPTLTGLTTTATVIYRRPLSLSAVCCLLSVCTQQSLSGCSLANRANHSRGVERIRISSSVNIPSKTLLLPITASSCFPLTSQ